MLPLQLKLVWIRCKQRRERQPSRLRYLTSRSICLCLAVYFGTKNTNKDTILYNQGNEIKETTSRSRFTRVEQDHETSTSVHKAGGMRGTSSVTSESCLPARDPPLPSLTCERAAQIADNVGCDALHLLRIGAAVEGLVSKPYPTIRPAKPNRSPAFRTITGVPADIFPAGEAPYLRQTPGLKNDGRTRLGSNIINGAHTEKCHLVLGGISQVWMASQWTLMRSEIS